MSNSADARDWDTILQILTSLIKFKTRAEGLGWRESFEWMYIYLERLELDQKVKSMSFIHVAGTKGKGSTCTMVDGILRSCGYSTALYTSPHLCDVRERFRVNGRMISKEEFSRHFWWCYQRLEETATQEIGMPGYFRFMTLLGLKIFCEAAIDVVVLEVGLGGRLDATNVIPPPAVCGITSLGFDHMEMLGDTLPLIATEKGGILKAGSPGFTVPQPQDALEALQACARKAGTSLQLIPPLDTYTPEGGGKVQLGIHGEHQHVNAALAVMLSSTWEARVPAAAGSATAKARVALVAAGNLPADYCQGLLGCEWPGRCQVVHDPEPSSAAQPSSTSAPTSHPNNTHSTHPTNTTTNTTNTTNSMTVNGVANGCDSPDLLGGGAALQARLMSPRLSFYLDGAHTVESIAPCALWFGEEMRAAALQEGEEQQHVLMFNCTRERDPGALLPALVKTLDSKGVHIHHAIFVPPESNYAFLAPSPQTQTLTQQPPPPHKPIDLSWQLSMQRIWQELQQQRGLQGQSAARTHCQHLPDSGSKLLAPPPVPGFPLMDSRVGAVVPSLRLAVGWLRQSVSQQPSLKVKVLVTGSLYVVGDMLGILGCPPK